MERMSSAEKIKKTRNRIPTSCDYCRKRKLKCDRQKPCSNCVKSQSEHMCKYAVQPRPILGSGSLPRVNLNNEIIKLKLKLNKLERILHMNKINISDYDNILPDLTDSNSASPDDSDDDPVVSLTEKFDSMIIKENKILHSGTTSYVTFVVQDKYLNDIFQAYAKRHLMIYESYQQRQKLKAADVQNEMADNHLAWLTSNAATDVSSCDMDSLQNSQLSSLLGPSNPVTTMQAKLVLDVIEDINKKLPPLYVVNVLVDHFFKYVYPLLPIVDEEIFREELSYVIIPTQNGGCKVAITHLQNASIISLLLVILRYAYLAVNIKDYADDSKAIGNEFLVAMIKGAYVIDSSYVILAKNLLMSLPAEDHVFKKVTLRNIQVLLFLRLYQIYSPEMHDESKEHSLILSLIIQMCRSLGGNRDPEYFPNIFKDYREITVWRRIFYKLLALDVHNAYEYGCPIIIADDEFDIKLPTLKDEDMRVLNQFKKGLSVNKTSEEIKKLVVDAAINKDIALEYESVKLIREGLNLFQNFKNPNKKSLLFKAVDKLQDFIDNKIPSIWEMIQDGSKSSNQLEKIFGVSRVKRIEIRTVTQNFLMGFYYLLYLNEQDKTTDNEGDFNIDTNGSESSPSSYSTDSTPEFNKKKYKYAIRATELALSIFKLNYDFTRYSTQSLALDGDSKQYKALKCISNKCEVFLFNRIETAFMRSFLFLTSLFLKQLKDKTISFENLIHNFSNTIDSTVVLKFFNRDVSLKKNDEFPLKETNCEFPFLLFQYTKDLFFMHYSLKNDFFICWRNTMTIKMFINYFKAYHNNVCSTFLHPQFNNSNQEASDNISPHESISTDESNTFPGLDSSIEDFAMGINSTSRNDTSNDMPESTNMGDLLNQGFTESENTFEKNFFDIAAPSDTPINFENTGNDLSNLIYDNLDNMVDAILKDSSDQRKVLRDVELFNMNDYGAFSDLGYNKSTLDDRDQKEAEIDKVFGAYSQNLGPEKPKKNINIPTGINLSMGMNLDHINTSNLNRNGHSSISTYDSLSTNRGSTSTSTGGYGGAMSTGSTTANSEEITCKTPDLSMFGESPVDFTQSAALGYNNNLSNPTDDIISDLQNKGSFY